MNNKQRKTLSAIFSEPIDGTIEWFRVESMLLAMECRLIEGDGSSVTFEKGGIRAHFHRPHPQKESLRYRIKAVREFLIKTGMKQ